MKDTGKTNAMRILEQKKVEFDVHNYVDSGVVSGMEVAEVLGQNPDTVFKTLVTVGKTKQNYVFLVPVNKELDLRKAAQAVHEKSVEMIKSKELLGLTGYIHGGCSPVGMKKTFITVIDKSAEQLSHILFSGGKIGYQIEMKTEDLKKVIVFQYEELT